MLRLNAPPIHATVVLLVCLAAFAGCTDNSRSSSSESRSEAQDNSATNTRTSTQSAPAKPNEVLASADSPTQTTTVESMDSTGVATNIDAKQRHRLGRRSFLQCRACHTLKEGEPQLAGPNLYGLFGSKVASKTGFNYSTALSSTGVTWNEENLKSWLRDPKAFAPGTLMVFDGVKDEQQLSYLVEYMKAETAP